MKTRQWVLAGLLVLAACGESATGPAPAANPLRDGGGLMGSGTIAPPPPPSDDGTTQGAASDTTTV